MEKYFAYGSNMNHDQFRARCPDSRFIGPARLDGYQLAFTRYSSKRGGGVDDIRLANGACIWGGLFELSPADLATLDRSEGTHQVPPAYRRVIVEVASQDQRNGAIKAFTYEVVTKGLFKPSASYLGAIIEGALHCSLPADYIQTLQNVEVA